MDELTIRQEAYFADLQYGLHAGDLDINERMFSKYSQPTALWDWRQLAAALLGDVEGKHMLDLGCGMGEEVVYFARLGATVTGIDISQVGLSIAMDRARYNGVLDRVALARMSADALEFDDGSFDLVHGLGILHHVGIEAGLKEVKRVLKPGGTAVFLEPLGDSPTVERVKLWMMMNLPLGFTDVTDHEENLRYADIERLRGEFATMDLYPYHLLYRAKRFLPRDFRDTLRRIDLGLLALAPALRRFAGAVVIRVRKAR